MTQIPVKIFPSLNTRECHLALLNRMLEKEDEYYTERRNKGIFGFQKGPGLVTAGERRSAVIWLCSLSRGEPVSDYDVSGSRLKNRPSCFNSGFSGREVQQHRTTFGPDTLCLSVAFLDEILTSTRVESKYLYCLALTGLYLAAKLWEEPEVVPYLADLNREFCGSRYSIQELSRMERVLLTRLNWRLTYPTVDGFIQLMLAISLIPQEVSAHLLRARDTPTDIRCSLETVLASHKLSATCNDEKPLHHIVPQVAGGKGRGFVFLSAMQNEFHGFRPSMLALAMLSLTLEANGYPQWFGIMVNLQQLFKVDSCDVIKCRESVSGVLTREKDKENVGSLMTKAGRDDCVFLEVGIHGNKRKSPRKRIRQRSKGSESCSSVLGSVAKIKTPLAHIFVDEIADAVWI